MLITELKNCFNKKEFKFIFTALWIISLGAYMYVVFRFKLYGVKFLRSSYDSTFMINSVVSSGFNTIMLLLPVISGMIYSDSYFEDVSSGRINYINTRISYKKYVITKAKAIGIMTFLTITIPLTANVVLCELTFPKVGMDNNYALPPYDIGVQNYSKEFWMDLLRLENPILYTGIRIVFIGLIASLLALIVYGLYFNEKICYKYKLAPIIIIFVAYIGSDTIFTMFDIARYSLTNYLYFECEGTGLVFTIYLIVLSLTSVLLIGIAINKREKL